jgi:3D (Asp-Asp-Asp) domain-containing protein
MLLALLATARLVAYSDEYHVVQRNESLWKISKRHYGSGLKWRRIWRANRKKIRNPNVIHSGQRLLIPTDGIPAGYKHWKTVTATVTAYTPYRSCCGRWADGRTSTMKRSRNELGCAADPRAVPYGTFVKIPGAGIREVDDTGRAMKRSWRRGRYHLDVRFLRRQRALKWGRKRLRVELWRKDEKESTISTLARKRR